MPKWSDDVSTVTVVITPLESGCELTLTHELTPEWADYIESARNSWSKMLGALEKALS